QRRGTGTGGDMPRARALRARWRHDWRAGPARSGARAPRPGQRRARHRAAEIRVSAAARGRILVADDDGMLRDIATAMLENAGFAVETVGSGDAALAACLREMPQLLLLDVEMPDGNGYQACTNIRVLPGGRDVPIVMVTGFDDATSINLAYDAGATDFV